MAKKTARIDMEKIEKLSPDVLKACDRNSRTHSEAQVKELAKSITEFGFLVPVLIDGENNVIAGHGRILAAQRAGLKEIPCLRITHLTQEQQRAYVIADNRLAEKAEWDRETLRLELDALEEAGFDITFTGFGKNELRNLRLSMDALKSEDEEARVEVKIPVTRRGDLWILREGGIECRIKKREDAAGVV
jgi:ParB-like chromosome segregation protein Spo0J